MSTGCTSFVWYPISSKISRSLARVDGSQDTVLIGRNDVNLDYKESSVIGKIANMLVILVGVTVIICSIIEAI